MVYLAHLCLFQGQYVGWCHGELRRWLIVHLHACQLLLDTTGCEEAAMLISPQAGITEHAVMFPIDSIKVGFML